MPSRSRGRRASPPVLIQEDEDLDFEVSYSEEEDGNEEEEGSEGEGSDSEEEQQEEEDDEEEDGESIGERCGPSVRARVSGGAAAERANKPTCPVCMEAWTADGAHRIRKPPVQALPAGCSFALL